MSLNEHELVSKIFDTTQEGIVVTDVNQTVIMINKEFTSTTGYQKSDMLNQDIKIFGLQELNHDIWRSINYKDSFTYTINGIKKSGGKYTQSLTIHKIKDKTDEVSNYIFQFIDTKEESQKRLEYYDNLTSLPNRILFEDRLAHAIKNAKRTNTIIALMFIDLDNFKIINDTLGHTLGDKLLIEVSDRLKSTVRENDTLSRIGGDEFALVLENIKDKIDVVNIAKKITLALSTPFMLNNTEAFTSASIGISLYPDDGDTTSDMMRKADTAMYRVKELGKNNFEFFTDSMNKAAFYELEIISDLKKALDNNILELHYQPQVQFNTGKILGVEALIRWIDPIKGFISPEIFISAAEKSGLMGQVEEFVFDTGAKQQSIWQSMGINIQMSLNISNQQFSRTDFTKITMNIFKKYKLDPKTIDLELTERIVMDSDESFKKIQELKNAGFSISLDDFGTGQSSLSYLKKYDIDKLKIDKSFVDDLPNDEQSCGIAKAIVSLADAMNMKTVAEGVEDTKQLDFLQGLNCNTYQGWYFSKALRAEDFEELYLSNKLSIKESNSSQKL